MKIPFGKINLALLTILVLLFGVALFVPVKPLEIKDVKINGSEFKAGGEMSFTIDRCKNVDKAVSGTASRYFVDANDPTKSSQFISSTDDLGEKGCAKVTRNMDIPAHIKDGTYRLKFVTRYFPSVLREPITVEYTSKQTFTVKGQELSAQLNNILAQLEGIRANLGTDTVSVAPQESTVTYYSQDDGMVADAAPTAQPTPLSVVNQPQQNSTPVSPQLQEGLLQRIIDTTTGLIETTTRDLLNAN